MKNRAILCCATIVAFFWFIYGSVKYKQTHTHTVHTETVRAETVSAETEERVEAVRTETVRVEIVRTEPVHTAPVSTTRVPDIKYILQWTSRISPFDLIEEGFQGFMSNNCKHSNCYVTADRHFLPALTDFDAIAFNAKVLWEPISLPERRSEKQKYIFVAYESPHNYRVCDSVYENFFNWTWSYKLNSDFRWGYITIYDLDGNVVGPKLDMKWPDLKPIDDELKKKLDRKSKGATWFVSNCNTIGKRETFFRKMVRERVAMNYSWSMDVYGSCGPHVCTRSNEQECYKMIEEDYRFYFSFENSFAEDYVTEKLLTALNHYAIPVVYGGANYSRFLPPGSYLNARELGPKRLVETMNEIYNDKEKYYEFFKWRNHFKYKYTLEQDVCDLCAALNDEDKMKERTVYGNFRRWWNDGQWDGRDSTCRGGLGYRIE